MGWFDDNAPSQQDWFTTNAPSVDTDEVVATQPEGGNGLVAKINAWLGGKEGVSERPSQLATDVREAAPEGTPFVHGFGETASHVVPQSWGEVGGLAESFFPPIEAYRQTRQGFDIASGKPAPEVIPGITELKDLEEIKAEYGGDSPEYQAAAGKAAGNVLSQMIMAGVLGKSLHVPPHVPLRAEPLVPEPPPTQRMGPGTIADDVRRALQEPERRFTLQEPPPEPPPNIAPAPPVEDMLANVPKEPPVFNPELGPQTIPEFQMPLRTESAVTPGARPLTPGAAKQLGKLKAYVEKSKKLNQNVDPDVVKKIAEIEGPPPGGPVQAPVAAEPPPPGAGAAFAPYADEILKSVNYVDKPEARLARDAAGLYEPKLREINLPTKPEHNPYAVEFVKAHEQAHHIWSGLQNATAADLMHQNPAAFAAFKETSAGKSQIIRHKIKGEWVDNPSGFDWIEAVPDLYAEMKVKGIRNPELEAWLERAIPEANKPPLPGAGAPPEVPPSERGYTGMEPLPQKPSKIGQSIEAKAVEAKLTKGFPETAGYDPITIKDQAARASSLVKENPSRAGAIIRGEEPLPPEIKGTSLITAMEEHLLRNPSAQGAYELANSRLVSLTSEAAQEMRLMAERVPDGITAKFAEIKKAREEGAALRKETKVKVKKEINGEVVKAASKRPTWEQFVKEIVC